MSWVPTEAREAERRRRQIKEIRVDTERAWYIIEEGEAGRHSTRERSHGKGNAESYH